MVRVGPILKHPNADALEITNVDGRPVIMRSGSFAPGDLAIYVPIDALVPVKAEDGAPDPRFGFLANGHKTDSEGRARIRAARLRGVFSMGLLVPISPGEQSQWVEGDEVSAKLRIGTWEPGVLFGIAPDAEKDPGFLPCYDLESARKWAPLVLVDGEEVVLTEKVHGANGRFAFHRGRLWVASRNRFLREPAPGAALDAWWTVARALELADRLATVPGVAIYGEVYGNVQDLTYGRKGANLVLFDALRIDSREWLNVDELADLSLALGLPIVPTLYRGPWSADLADLAEGSSPLAGGTNVREGWVCRPVRERTDERLGRVILKRHGEGFLTRKGG